VRYLSVCSGIEAATVAWHPLGWTPAAFSEIEAFPRAVLAHHYPTVPLHGDFTTIKGDEYGAIDLLVGGTPCQDFSSAGLRAGIAGDRGNLTLEFLRLAARTKPRWIVWENVPGVLSSDGGRALGSFLGGLGELGYGFAYRVLDAQYCGVPQRRRRVFVVGCLGDWRRAAAVLFERESLLGNPPPRRETGEGVARRASEGAGGRIENPLGATIARRSTDLDNSTYVEVAPTIPARTKGGGGLGTDFDCDGSLIAPEISLCRNAGGMGRQDSESETLIAHSLRAEGFDALEDGTGRGTPIVPVGVTLDGTDKTIRTASYTDVAGALRARTPGAQENSSTTAVMVPVALAAEPGAQQQAYVAFDLRGREGGAQFEGPHNTANIRAASGGSSRSYVAAMAVRRLTPRECERLQGFPDDYSLVPYRGKPASDGPRYKALGNSMAVPVMRWIGQRIAMVEGIK
jgi:DNA (cytosine-5)-methyltransferase 1